TLLVLLVDEHQHHVFQRRLRNRHSAGERVQDANLDRAFSSRAADEAGKSRRGKSSQRSGTFDHHLIPPVEPDAWEDVGGKLRKSRAREKATSDQTDRLY